MDINDYRMYVRDMQISDDELELVMKDVINDIARDTKVFKELFGFTLAGCVDMYDMKMLFDLHTQLKKDNIVELSINGNLENPDSILNYLNTIDSSSADLGKTCESEDGVDVEINTNDGKHNTFIDVIDILHVYDNLDALAKVNRNTNVRSVLFDWFEDVGNNWYKKKDGKLSKEFGYTDDSKYEIPLVGIVSVVPDLSNIDPEIESIIKSTLIAGLKYNISDMFLNIQNEQVSNLLYQRYYSAKRQLKFNYSSDLGNYFRYNTEWNR